MITSIRLFIILFLLNSCNFSKNDNNTFILKESEVEAQTMSVQIQEFLQKLKFKTKVESIKNNQKLLIKLYYHPDFFLDDGSNKLIISLIIHEFYESLKCYENIKFIVILEKFENDPLLLECTSSDILNIYHKSINNMKFVDFAKYSLKNISSTEILMLNEIINILNEEVGEFNFKGDFWLLLFEFSKNENQEIKKQFKLLVKSAGFKKFNINQDNLWYFFPPDSPSMH